MPGLDHFHLVPPRLLRTIAGMDQAVTVTLTACLDALPAGDPKSVDLLVDHAQRRLRAMVRRMFPRDGFSICPFHD